MRDLTARQQRFVDEYLVDLNAIQAALRAGYGRTSAENGTPMRSRMVTQAVAAAIDRRARRTGITADRVVQELARIGLSDLRQAFTGDGDLRCLTMLDDDMAAAISSVKVVTRSRPRDHADGAGVEYVTEIKLWDKVSALEKLGKHLGMFREQIDVSLKGDLAAMIAARRQRVVDGRGG